ncbi:MAG TPA: dihydrodipicolinate synthase family protein [Bryobacteraceae bacterium]|nr:dihydrodipicolinate synthase family protein [Bryobacteraceae bacterium]
MAKNRTPAPAQGVYADLATPRRANSAEADAAIFLDYLDSVARAGARGSRVDEAFRVDGLVLFGSTGEFIHFDLSERMRAAALAIRRSRVPVLIGVSHSTLEGALELADHANSIGAAGVLLMPPYFYGYPEDQIFHYYKLFAQGLGGSTLAYLHNSPLSANLMSPGLIERVLATGSFAGLFNEQNSSEFFERLRQSPLPQPVSLLGGDGDLSAQTTGIVSAIASALPELPVAMYRARASGQVSRMEELGRALEEFRSRLGPFPSIVGLKQAAIARGWLPPRYAVPPDPAMCESLQSFKEWFTQWLPDVLSKCATKG